MKFYPKVSWGLSPVMRQVVLVMRLTIILITLGFLQVSAKTFAQKVTLDTRGASLESVLKSIKQQTGYDYVIDQSLLEGAHKITLSLRGASVDEALEATFKNQPLTYTIDDKVITIKEKTPSFLDRVVAVFAAIDVRGRVVDSLGNGLAGATVSVKSGKQGTQTAANGEFFLKNVDENAVLVISYLGYVTSEQRASKEAMLIVLKESHSKLDEVQIQAYGRTTRRLSTGDITSVKSDEIARQPVDNPLYALQGRVTGLEITPTSGLPGAPVNIKIRGRNTLRDITQGSADPLVVIDGLPVSNNIEGLGNVMLSQVSALSFINPSDIESIEVLKDADATSIYGSRGANGVILITTKKGNFGDTKVNIDVSNGWSTVPKRIGMLNTQQYLEIRREAYSNAGIDPATMPSNNSPSRADLKLWDQSRYTDWQKEVFGGIAGYLNANGSVTGGTSALQYLIGGTYRRETSVFPGKNSNAKSNVHFSLTGQSSNKRFKSMLTGSYQYDKTIVPGIDLTRSAFVLPPNAPSPYNEDKTLNWEPYPSGRRSWQNPYAQLDLGTTNNFYNITTSALFSYEVVKNLIAKVQLGYGDLRGNAFRVISVLANRPPELANDPSVSAYNYTEMRNINVEPQLTYRTTLFNAGTIDLLVGASYQKNETNSQLVQGFGFPNDALIRSMQSATTVSSTNDETEYRYNAAFARLTYNYEDKYLLNVSARRDGSSRFGPGKQFGNFGSLGAAWIFSEERFIKDKFKQLTFGKLRFSYGTSGNDGIGDYQYLERYTSYGSTDYQGVRPWTTRGLYNPDYHWELTKKAEIGIDLGFFDRVSFSANYFRNRSNSQLLTYPLPFTSGPGSYTYNLPANIQNDGLELLLETKNINTSNFRWTTTFNFTRNRNKLLSFPGLDASPYYTQYEVGKPFDGMNWVYNYRGVDPQTGIYQFQTADGNITSDPSDPARYDNGRYIRVSTTPEFYGGVSNSFTYKGLRLDIFVQYSKGFGTSLDSYFYSPGLQTNLPSYYYNRWQKSGDISNIQKIYILYPDTYDVARNAKLSSNAMFEDVSFIRIKNVYLAYDLPSKITRKLKISSLQLFMQGQNLLTFTHYRGLDPETQSLSLPPLRTITLGLRSTF
jgi:TonB-linked SusC/RagA family outer membrane protein